MVARERVEEVRKEMDVERENGQAVGRKYLCGEVGYG